LETPALAQACGPCGCAARLEQAAQQFVRDAIGDRPA
jgi:hypothetical protein